LPIKSTERLAALYRPRLFSAAFPGEQRHRDEFKHALIKGALT